MKSNSRRRYLYILYPLFSLFLVSQWFHDRRLLAHAEQGLHLFDPQRTLAVYSNSWIEVGLGVTSPFYISRIPYYALLAFLSSLGIPSWVLQAAVFFTVLSLGLFFSSKVSKLLLKKEVWYIHHIVALFYLCNLFVMSQILIRFIDALFFAWAFLPVFLYVWIQWIDLAKARYLFFLLVVSLVSSSLFTLFSSVFLIWIPACLYSFIALCTGKKKKQTIITSSSGFIVWLLCSWWWLLPIWQLRNTSYAELASVTNNFTSLIEVSKFYPLSELLLLRQTFFFGENGPWAVLYQSWKYFLPSIMLLGFMLTGFVTAIRKRYHFLVVLFIVGFFFAKGTNPPFGEFFYNFLFTYIPPMQILRNPYEKIGLLFVLPYIMLSVLGLSTAVSYLKRTAVIIMIVFLAGTLLLVRPMLGKDFFPSPYHVQVPGYYSQANTYIAERTNNRIFHLPYLRNSSTRYSWGYIGEDPSEYSFENVTLAKMSHIPSVDRYYLSLEEYLPHKHFPKLLALINIDSLLMHNDYVSEVNKQNLVQLAHEHLQAWDGISEKKSFGELDVYSINKYKLPGMFYTVDAVIPVASMGAGFDLMLQDDTDIGTTAFIVTTDNPKMKALSASAFRKAKINYIKKSNQEYAIQVTNAENPFVLVFSMNFNPLWHAKIDDSTITEHYKINGYANAWVVDKKGSYTIDISFDTR